MVKIISEICFNHNGSIDICKKLILLSKVAGCDYVKIQKRNPDICVPEEQKKQLRKTPWGEISYIDYKWKLEFSEEQIKECADTCKDKGKAYNVYFYNAEIDQPDWLEGIKSKIDVTLDANITNPADYFNK